MKKSIVSLTASILTGGITSFVLISYYFSGNRQFENLALGTQTVSYFAMNKNKKPVHIQKVNDEEETEFLEQTKKNKKTLLILGNSQTHSINQKKEMDVNYIELLNKKWDTSNINVVCHSLPNAGLQEFYLSYKYWKNKFNISYIIIPLFMDDLREDGIRDVFFFNLVKSKFQLTDTSNDISKKINKDLQGYWSRNENTKSNDDNEDMAALKETVQETTETYFNQILNSNWTLWQNRPNVRGDFFNWLYKARNTVLGINANTVRKMIPQRYEYNMHALELIIEDCIKSNIKILLYIPPIRSDVTIPYDENDYSKFKSAIENLTLKYPNKVFYKNFESIIPENLWGYKEATNLIDDREIDFMHFQFKGHQILADSLQPAISNLIQK